MSLNQITATLISHWGSDRDVANQAWASTTDLDRLQTRTDDDVRRVITQSIVPLHHDTPKERVWLDFTCTAPIFVERQFDKYRMTVQYQDFQVEFNQAEFGRHGITQNELSGRYRTIPERPYTLPKDVAEIADRAYQKGHGTWLADQWAQDQEDAYNRYRSRLATFRQARDLALITADEYKRARDVLRGSLGTSFLTDFRLVLNLNAFEHIMNQRLPPSAQLESRVLAARMLQRVVDGDVASVTVDKMIDVNGWDKYMIEINKLCLEDAS